MALPAKNYYQLIELATAWKCSVDDIFHHFRQDRIRLGIRVHHKMLYGLDAQLHTVGIYSVTGVITIPQVCAETWEMGSEEVSRAGGFLVEPDYPPLITEASYMNEASFAPPMFPWAPGHDWENPETDYGLIARFVVAKNDLCPIKKGDVVVHAVERARFEGEHNDATPLDPVTTAANRYTPSNARREARKLDTQVMYESWRKAYREGKRKRPGMSDVWYSQQIAKMDIAQGRDADTIRKHMKT